METVSIPNEEDIKRWVREIIREELAILFSKIRTSNGDGQEPLLTRKEIAAYLRISLVTLSDWIKRGLPVHRKRKRGRVLFIKEEVLQWVKGNPDIRDKYAE